jgi:hypothetical protein
MGVNDKTEWTRSKPSDSKKGILTIIKAIQRQTRAMELSSLLL